jgi:hypothetical protein
MKKLLVSLLILIPATSFADYTCRAVVRKDTFVTKKYFDQSQEDGAWMILINRYHQGETALQTLRELIGTSVSYFIPFDYMKHDHCQHSILLATEPTSPLKMKYSMVSTERTLFDEHGQKIRYEQRTIKSNDDLPGEHFHVYVDTLLKNSDFQKPSFNTQDTINAQYEEIFTCAFHCTNNNAH